MNQLGPVRRDRRLVAHHRGTVTVLIGLLAALALPIITGQGLSSARADTSGLTVTGSTAAWDAVNQTPLPDLPTVTVSQTQDLVDQVVHVSWTGFTPSSNNTSDPTPLPGTSYQPGNTLYPVLVMQCRGLDPQASPLDNNPDCYSIDAGSTLGTHGLGNAIRTVTQPDGTGSADLHLVTKVSNDLLGCDSTHPCSIAVVPAWGGFQPASDEPARCDDHSFDYPTEANSYDLSTYAADVELGARCSWANRIVIPLHFAPTADNCPAAKPGFASGGSPMLQRLVQQWQAGWCQDQQPLDFDYDSSTNEYLARQSFLSGGGALGSSTDVAFTTQPLAGGGTRKFSYAPIATTGIAVAFLLDDPSTGKLIDNITLNARLVAKMLTQSYAPYQYSCVVADTATQSGTCDPAVRGNAQSILQDPEFLGLNPTLKPEDFSYANLSIGEFFPLTVSGNSDLIWTLTSWIAADPDAAAFLKGQPDEWGTRVNTYYRGIEYPTSQLTELDPGYTDPQAPAGNGTMQNTWQPVNGLDTVGRLMVNDTSSAISTSQTACASPPCPFPKVTEFLGTRALFGIMDQGQAAAYALPAAHLINNAGKAIAPTTASLTAALSSMTTNSDGITQRPNFSATNAAAYPLPMVGYAAVPTCGLDRSTAQSVSLFLSKVNQSQVYGRQPGTIAGGYLALTPNQLAQTAKTAAGVQSVSCTEPSSQTNPGPGVPTPGPPAPNSGTSNGGTGSGGGSNNPAAGGAGPTSTGGSAAPPLSAGTNKSPVASTSAAVRPAAYGVKRADSAGPMRFALPILLIVGAALLLGGPGAYFAASTGAWSAVTSRLRRFGRTG